MDGPVPDQPPEDPTTADLQAQALAPLLAAVAERTGVRRHLAAAFARATFRRVPLSRLHLLDVQATAAWLADAFTLVDRRRPGDLALRVFDPDVDGGGTVVEVNLEDGPFLLSTITEEVAARGHTVVDLLHPVLGIRRDDEGRIAEILPARDAAARESYIRLELEGRPGADEQEAIARDLRAVIEDSRAATRDFASMRERILDVAGRIRQTAAARYAEGEIDEAAALLLWLLDDNFILLGYREYDLVEHGGVPCAEVRRGSGLGILADEDRSAYAEPVPLAEIPPALRQRLMSGDLVTVSRTNRLSTVHRRVRMVYVGIKKIGDDGSVRGEWRFLGLFAQKAFAEPASAIPVLRRKLRQILEREDIVDHSFEERAVRALFEAFPKHELFAAHTDDLRRTLVELLDTQQQQDIRLMCRTDPHGRGVSVLVAVPRERFNAAIRVRVQELLAQRYEAVAVDYHLSMTEGGQALLHFVLHLDERIGAVPIVDVAELEREVAALTRSWDDRLSDALVEAYGEPAGRQVASRWAGVFPPGYQAVTAPLLAVDDVREIEALLAAPAEVSGGHGARMVVQRAPDAAPGHLRFKLFKAGEGVELSSFLPIIESLGLVVVDEVPHHLAEVDVHLHDFGVRTGAGDTIDVAVDGPRLSQAAVAMWRGRAEADSLNRLVLRAGLGWEEVAVLRVYRRYRRQVGTSFTEEYQNEAFVEHPDVARALLALFDARFHPERTDADVPPVRASVDEALERVERLDQDRILRSYLGMIEATLRTNRWAPRDGMRGSTALALKLDSARVPDLPRPAPAVEVFVAGPEMEGAHLRGGPVARGGLRWSDRVEDFRTEVLGLMKAQMIKNAVIVPTGSKGGFVLRRPPADPAALPAEVQRHYQNYIRALLDVTDNVVDGVVTPPPGVRRADGDDPYLVVAADRGTATFSDVANAISEAYGFWLGDAFASGGSRGYDHKAMGITARGAWVAVQRHFRELSVDVQTEPISVVGIGDMSGDVFGNGLLRSRSVKLVAAFDHRDIFLDPDPDVARSFDERARLFALPRSSWQDYDRTVLSPGGGVWSRSVKEITLSPQARMLLHLDVERISPPDLIRAILRAPSDLLFAGGIGTFVKASSETHAEVGDRANDAIRVDASELGARVVGEGGNLALTQRARIQYARRGGRCNTDATDNSAGVDTSDREVNLKILLGQAITEGVLTGADRDELLVAMTDDVAEAVLRDVYLQTWTITSELGGSVMAMDAYEQLMVDFEEAGRLDREVELLPATDEMQRRAQAGAGLTRPELAVLLGYAKVDLRTRLLGSDVPDQPALRDALIGYFPRLIRERYAHLADHHRLRRELVATVVANDVVDRMGITYVSRTAHELGCMAYEVAAAYWIAREVADADAHWRSIEALDGRAPSELQLELKALVDRLVDTFTRAYLRQGATDIAATVARDRPAFEALEATLTNLGALGAAAHRQALVDRFVDLGIDERHAERLVSLGDLGPVPDIALVARRTARPVEVVADVFLRLSEALPLDRLHAHLQQSEPQGHWQQWQHRGLVDELRQIRRLAAEAVLAGDPQAEADDAVAAFLTRRGVAQERVTVIASMLERERPGDLHAVAVAVRALRDIIG
jgi:glutamate dehydrogenase